MAKGICQRCWREGELLDWWPIGRACLKKIPNIEARQICGSNIKVAHFTREIAGLPNGPGELLRKVEIRIFNFLPIHFHYNSLGILRWGEGKVDELDLAINVMALACPPTEVTNKRRVKLAGGSVVSEDVWNLHHFFRSEFIEKIPYEGGSINLQDVREWIDRYSQANKGQFELSQLEDGE